MVKLAYVTNGNKMRPTLTLFGAAAILTFATSIANADDKTAPGGTGVVQSTEGQGATTNKDITTNTPTGAKTGTASGNATGGTGVETSSQGGISQDKN